MIWSHHHRLPTAQAEEAMGMFGQIPQMEDQRPIHEAVGNADRLPMLKILGGPFGSA